MKYQCAPGDIMMGLGATPVETNFEHGTFRTSHDDVSRIMNFSTRILSKLEVVIASQECAAYVVVKCDGVSTQLVIPDSFNHEFQRRQRVEM